VDENAGWQIASRRKFCKTLPDIVLVFKVLREKNWGKAKIRRLEHAENRAAHQAEKPADTAQTAGNNA
jgi:hypothetical protein